jgi:hypothetical protein
MADIAKLEAEALTALRQYQEAITRELQQLLSVATNDPANAGKKHIVERLSNEGKEAANLYWNWHRALWRNSRTLSQSQKSSCKSRVKRLYFREIWQLIGCPRLSLAQPPAISIGQR